MTLQRVGRISEVAQIAFGREIAERIEGHGLASRKYST
jgi:hypothetical protein